jgi:hypothetical protein
MRSILCLGALSVLSACSKPVDPAYLAQVEQGAESFCKCVGLSQPATLQCLASAKSVYPTNTPTGEAPGIYEQALDDASKAKLDHLREQARSCGSP